MNTPSSAPVMSGLVRAALGGWATKWVCVDVGTRAKIAGLKRGVVRSRAWASRPWVEQHRRRSVEFTTDACLGVDQCGDQLRAVCTPCRRRRLRGLGPCPGSGAGDRNPHDRADRRGHEVNRTGGRGRSPSRADRERVGRARRRPSLRRAVQPRIPQGGGGSQRLHEAGSHRDRERLSSRIRRGRRAAPRTPVRALQPQPRQGSAHGRALGGAHQVRRERHAGHQDQLDERGRQSRRPPRRGHRGGASGHRRRSPHRLPLHLRRLRLRRLVLPEGCPGAHPHGPGSWLRRRDHARRVGRERASEVAAGRQDGRLLRGGSGRQDDRAVGACVQSPTRTTCARRRAKP